jgi:hypothetical protein
MYGRGKVVVNPIGTVEGAPAISTLAAPAPSAPGAKKKPTKKAKKPTNWIGWGGVALLFAAVVFVPMLLGKKKDAPTLPAPPAQNPRRRRRR